MYIFFYFVSLNHICVRSRLTAPSASLHKPAWQSESCCSYEAENAQRGDTNTSLPRSAAGNDLIRMEDKKKIDYNFKCGLVFRHRQSLFSAKLNYVLQLCALVISNCGIIWRWHHNKGGRERLELVVRNALASNFEEITSVCTSFNWIMQFFSHVHSWWGLPHELCKFVASLMWSIDCGRKATTQRLNDTSPPRHSIQWPCPTPLVAKHYIGSSQRTTQAL